jgi:chromosome segregation ATPase
MEYNTEIERIYEIIEELKRDMKTDKKKLIELENHIIKLQQEIITLPKIISEQNKSQTWFWKIHD